MSRPARPIDPPRDESRHDAPALALTLLDWYRTHQRALPWRRRKDAYAIWVSEIMLQQTQVRTARLYYPRFLSRFPRLETLALASEQQVLSLWQGLGYYRRARDLWKASRILVRQHAGRWPRSVEALRELPGIGRYTAAAIASIAFDHPEPALDGNVLRFLCRLTGEPRAPKSAAVQRRLEAVVRLLFEQAAPSSITPALMEFGALVCTPQSPHCADCPFSTRCLARQLGQVERIPFKARPVAVMERRVVVLLVSWRNRILLVRQRDDAEHWRGLWTFPFREFGSTRGARAALRHLLATHGLSGVLASPREQTPLAYPVTRYRFLASLFEVRLGGARAPAAGHARWVPLSGLDHVPMPAPHRRWIRLFEV